MALNVLFAKKVLITSFSYKTRQWENMTQFAVTSSVTELFHETTCSEFLLFPFLLWANYVSLLH